MNYKELFRAQLLRQSGFAQTHCCIDMNKFSSRNLSGCFKLDDQYIVYDMDEHSHLQDVRIYHNPKDAYSNLAKRLGFTFELENVVDYMELFKEQLLKQPLEVQKLCSIYADNYYSLPIPHLSGCFQAEGQWIVYKYNEKGYLGSVKVFSNPNEAYSLLAKQLGFTFEI